MQDSEYPFHLIIGAYDQGSRTVRPKPENESMAYIPNLVGGRAKAGALVMPTI